MRIVVCIKQVPVVAALQFDPDTKTLKREGVPNEVSSFDVRALLKAVEIRAAAGGEVIVVTMGPPQARDALVDCLALGADRAIHLCDRAFAGADTLATARTLALLLAREPFDLILCGRNSVDAETGQVGPEIAEILDLPQVVGAHTLSVDPSRRVLTAERQTDTGFETVTAPLPALVTAAEDLSPERFPSKADREAAKAKPCIEVHAAELAVDPSQFGQAGSPTEVVGLEVVQTTRLQRLVSGATVDEATAELTRVLTAEHGLFGEWRVRAPSHPALFRPVESPTPREVWVVAEAWRGTIRPVSLELLGRAHQLATATGGRVSAVLLGRNVTPYIATLVAYGAERVLVADDPALDPFLTEPYTAILADAIQAYGPATVLIPSTSFGRDLAPRVAARLQIGLTGDCIDLGLDERGRLLQYKPAFGGSIVAPIVSRTSPEMATIRPGMLPTPSPDPARTATVEHLPTSGIAASRVRVVDSRPAAELGTDLDEADVVIGIGKGLGSADRIAALQPLIHLLAAAICTTRDVTDEGWLPKHYQVGLTGRAIAPKLYIAVGIRGAFEHTVGVRRAEVIVAINKNPKALIFKAADYGLVGDYAEVVPALHRHLAAARAASQTER